MPLVETNRSTGWAFFTGMLIGVAAITEGVRQFGKPMAIRMRKLDLMDTLFVGAVAATLLRRIGARELGA